MINFLVPNHRLCQLGEFMLYDFHQLQKGLQLLSIFAILRGAITKSWLNKVPAHNKGLLLLFLLLLLLLKTFCQYFHILCFTWLTGECV